jgi:hypothetical protein
MEAANGPVEYAQKISVLLEDACYPVANAALKIATVLLEHRLNGQISSVLEAAQRVAEYGSELMPPEQTEQELEGTRQ